MSSSIRDYVFFKKVVILLFLVVLIGILYVLATSYNHNIQPNLVFSASVTDAQMQKYRKQRDEMSRQLNLMKKAYGQQSCEQLEVLAAAGKKVDSRVSENGGWCASTSSAASNQHSWDEGFSYALSKFFKGKTVGSFGDGPGVYKKHLDSLKEVVSYTAYDGAPFCENVTKGLVKFLDLTAPQYGLAAYDWVISVEVGEHIPAKFQNIYLDNLVRHAREGIVLSWAVPGQDGLSHVNNKALDEVIAEMNSRGFDIDRAAGEPLRAAAKYKWLQANVHVYRRVNPKTFVEEDV